VGTVPPAVIPSLTYAERDTAIKAGVSTSEVSDQNVSLSDTVTFYHPDGEVPPAYRYVVDIVKLQNLVFNLQLIFEADEWKGAPLIPNEQPTVNPRARKPKDAVAAVAALVDSAALQAILSDPETAKSTITAVIDGTNPKRLNVAVTVQLSGNSNIIDVTLNFGFFFGTPAVL
jgi:phage tail sheath gpL-like